jgi:hypothetical protein
MKASEVEVEDLGPLTIHVLLCDVARLRQMKGQRGTQALAEIRRRSGTRVSDRQSIKVIPRGIPC